MREHTLEDLIDVLERLPKKYRNHKVRFFLPDFKEYEIALNKSGWIKENG